MHTLGTSGDCSANWNNKTKCQDNKWGIDSLPSVGGRPFLTWGSTFFSLHNSTALQSKRCLSGWPKQRAGQHSGTQLDQLPSKISGWHPACHRYISLFFCHLFYVVITGMLLETLINSRNPFYFSIILRQWIPVPFPLPNSKKLHMYCNISAVKQLMLCSHLQHKHLTLKVDPASLSFDQEKFTVTIYLHTSLCLEFKFLEMMVLMQKW